ncbi:MAG: N-acetylglucosamine-6-phosphate deacetylase [Clostridiaceae bacterium]|jgi:N-acetylglucosamine-6-phosphate deacetylase|nr:N-acetylglucosamine-6-phosphate deacetylase [Clostridiaceae bacterium]
MTTLSNIKLFDGTHFRDETSITFHDGIITELGNMTCGIDMGGQMLTPGLIDLHMHGQMGENSMRPGGVMRISATQVQFGVTSFCPASVTDSDENTRIFLENVRQAMTYRKGARVLGAYLEGPYLDHDLRGVHDDRYIKDPSISHYCALVDGYEDIIVRVTLAPEKDGGMELVQYLTDQGITVSIGHSAASADETRKAIRLGINTTTHTFNAMRPLHHRQPGVLGVALTHPGISTEFIADMVHINPLIVKLIYLAKGVERCFCCTDSMEAAGMPDCDYQLGINAISVENGIARKGDRLAGSTLTMDRGLRLLVEEADIPLRDALRMGTRNPAEIIGRRDLGRLLPGAKADFVLWNETLQVTATYVDGQCLYHAD